MKTKLFLLASIAFSLFCKAQNVTIPDPIFKSYLVNNPAINTNGDAQIQVSEATAFTGTIDCSSRGIASMTGLEAFVNLKKLSCFGNLLTTLDVSKNTALTSIVCAGNQLATLDVTKNLALTELNLHTNQISTLDVSKNTLLTFLAFSNNLFTTIDVTKNTALTDLVCENNLLTSLDVSKNTNLINLDAGNNQFTSLNLQNNAALEMLTVSLNPLTALDLTGNPALTILNAIGNNYTTIDLSKNTALLALDFTNGKLKSLDISNNQLLELLLANSNQLLSVNLKNANNEGLVYVDLTGNPDLSCIQVDNMEVANNYASLEYWIKDASATYSINCNSTLGLNDISKSDVKIYPNPTKSSVNWSVAADVEVYNTVGQSVLRVKNSSSVNLSKFSDGVYIIVLKDKNGKELRRSKVVKH